MKRVIKRVPLTSYLWFSVSLLAFLSVSRLVISLLYFDRVSATDGWFHILIQGIRVDIATLSFLLVFPVLLSISFNAEKPLGQWINRLIIIWLTIVAVCFVYMELATPSFIQEYNIRPNRLFIEYLIYPKEVFGMLLKSHLMELILINLVAILLAFFSFKKLASLFEQESTISLKWRPLVAIVALFFIALGGRSTLGHRPLNPAMVYFSNDPLVNSLTLNSFYSVLWSGRQLMNEESANKLYGEMDAQTIIQQVRDFKNPDLNYAFSDIPSYAEMPSSYQGKPKNLVIILQESLGARFVGSLGGYPLTPSIDQLSQQGLVFTRLFATGTRSVRGIEAVITGFTPTPDRAVIKLDKSQRNFFTLAALLKRQGYHTEFIYGGEAHFDNMKSFFLGNGFDYISEQTDYINPVFVGSWGASDEDLLNLAHQKFEQLSQQQEPFFSLVFSSSNHDPFEYPAGRITPYESPAFTRKNAIKYADWAVGEFFKKAKKSHYWENTIFLVIADHDARSQGSDLVPIKSFHIPAVILGQAIEHRVENKIASQIDMPPTLLSLIGIANNSPMIGHDFSQQDDDFKGRALLQNGQNFGFLQENQMIILQPNKPAVNLTPSWQDFSLSSPQKADKNQTEQALALALWGKLAYAKKLLSLTEKSSSTSG
ncbi:MAG: LTA synthase family protein [Enterobacterales bacterium]|nr:LTA synthase family protein [Enterobacterales bacterium]